jgi:hypothetical protein
MVGGSHPKALGRKGDRRIFAKTLQQTTVATAQGGPEHSYPNLNDNVVMSGIQFVTDAKGRKVGVLIDLKKHGAIWEDFWDGLISESRRKEKGIPYEQYRAARVNRKRSRG